MATISEIENGLARYLDLEMVGQLPENSIQRVLMGVGVALFIKNGEANIASMLENPIIEMMGVVSKDNDGDIDINIDAIRDELKKQIPDSGIEYEHRFLGKMTFHKDDVDKLYNYIVK